LEYFPDAAGEAFRRALRSEVPADRNLAAAALAIIDRPWCHRLLLDLLDGSRGQEQTAEARAALMALPHQHLHHAVERWEHTNPHEPATDGITIAESFLRGRDAWMQLETEDLHERVLPLRGVEPFIG